MTIDDLPDVAADEQRRTRRIARLRWIALTAAIGVIVVDLVAVRSAVGQRADDVAFQGRAVEDPEITRTTNELLHTVTKSTLVLLTVALVLFALARRQPRLAISVGVTVVCCVVTTEVLKLHLLTRPVFDGVAGIPQNSYPSGHATIGMALSLGLVMVASPRRRWLAAVPAGAFAMFFGAAVLATGWHRPSDTLGAFLVCAAWYAAVTSWLLARGTAALDEQGPVEARFSGPLVVAAAVPAVMAGAAALGWSLGEDGLRTVDYAGTYVVVVVVLLALAIVEVVGYHQLLHGLTLDRPVTARSDRSST